MYERAGKYAKQDNSHDMTLPPVHASQKHGFNINLPFNQMNNRHTILLILFAVMTMMTSCLSDSKNEVTYYDDAAVTSFTLGTLKRTIHTTTKAGADSTYESTVDCSSYPFVINHELGLIYNVDSLPVNTHADKALINVTTKNGGYAYLKKLDNDSLTFIQSTDSIDFSKPRTLRVYANNGEWYREYKVEVRVHTESADSLYWFRKADNSYLAELQDMRAISFGSNIVVYGVTASGAKAYYTHVKDGNRWTAINMPASKTLSFAEDGRYLYALTDNGNIYSSSDMSTWTQEASSTSLSCLVAGNHTQLFALSQDGQLMLSDNMGATWKADKLDASADNLPTRDINGFCLTSETNADLTRFYLFGNRQDGSAYSCKSWSKIVDSNYDAFNQLTWMHQPYTSDTWHHPAVVNHLTVVPYNKMLLLIGGNGLGTDTSKPFDKVLFSQDNGLNWWPSKEYFLPKDFNSSSTSFAFVADNANHLWLIGGQTGQVWYGYLSTITWE